VTAAQKHHKLCNNDGHPYSTRFSIYVQNDNEIPVIFFKSYPFNTPVDLLWVKIRSTDGCSNDRIKGHVKWFVKQARPACILMDTNITYPIFTFSVCEIHKLNVSFYKREPG
jgi:hypothetical protein